MSIVENRKAFHDYFIEERIEAGMALEGWEVKAIRAGRANLKEAYVVVKGSEIMLIGAHITPLATASTHVHPDPTRSRKLLLHRRELDKLMIKTRESGHTLVPLQLYFKDRRAKVEIAVAKGKREYEKRQTIREREDKREAERAMRSRNRLGD